MMNSHIINRLLLLVISTLLFGCFSGLEYKKAQFNRDPGVVIEELKELNDFENANIKWRTSQFGDSVYYSLQVFLLNGKDLPDSDSSLYEIGQRAMKLVFESIDNETDYNKYVVFFTTEEKKGVAKFSSQKPFEYNLEELQ